MLLAADWAGWDVLLVLLLPDHAAPHGHAMPRWLHRPVRPRAPAGAPPPPRPQVAVRAEEAVLSGGMVRQKAKYERFLNKRNVSNPRRGAIKFRAPSRILWRTIRGMIPHKTPRGAAALDRLKAFEGIPHPYDKVGAAAGLGRPMEGRVRRGPVVRACVYGARLGPAAAGVCWWGAGSLGRCGDLGCGLVVGPEPAGAWSARAAEERQPQEAAPSPLSGQRKCLWCLAGWRGHRQHRQRSSAALGRRGSPGGSTASGHDAAPAAQALLQRALALPGEGVPELASWGQRTVQAWRTGRGPHGQAGLGSRWWGRELGWLPGAGWLHHHERLRPRGLGGALAWAGMMEVAGGSSAGRSMPPGPAGQERAWAVPWHGGGAVAARLGATQLGAALQGWGLLHRPRSGPAVAPAPAACLAS